LVKEAEAKNKYYELLKHNLRQPPISLSIPNLGIVNIPPSEYTPIRTIPRDSYLSSQALNFEGLIVVIGDYYFYNRTRSIEKTLTKRKRGEDTRSNSFARRVLN
jgi:hypothetical protein